jgi:cyanate permease
MLGRMICGFLPDTISDNQRIRYGVALSIVGMVILLLPFGNASLAGLLLIGVGFGPIFPAVIHSVPSRFGATYSADLTGYHMGGAFGFGYAVQLIFGYLAVLTGYGIMPIVLLLLLGGVYLCNEVTLRKIGQIK